jgi:SAM-dependent methyltransferase
VASELPLLYRDLAAWWPLLSDPEDYGDEAAYYAGLFREHSAGDPTTMLELGSGGGNNASHLKKDFDLTLVDLAPGMLDVSRALNPECAHALGDMRSVRLGQSFDCVFVHDAVSYLRTADEISRTADTIRAHLRPNGVAVIAPDYVAETFAPTTECGGHDGDDRGLRYLSWAWDPDPDDHSFVTDYAYLLRVGSTTEVHHDRHVEGLFSVAEWLELLTAAGLEAEFVTYDHEHGPAGSRVIVAKADPLTPP